MSRVSSRMKPCLECKEYFKMLSRRCLNGEHLIVKEEILFIMDFLKSLHFIEKSDSLIQCIRVCVYNIIDVNDPDDDYKNYRYMDTHIKQKNGISWMIDMYFNRSSVNKYYQLLMTNLLNPTKHSISKLTNTFEIDSIKMVNYKYFLVKLTLFNMTNKLKSISHVNEKIKNIYNLDENFNTKDDIVSFLSTRSIYNIQDYYKFVEKLELCIVEI
jgi:hypothetical protein